MKNSNNNSSQNQISESGTTEKELMEKKLATINKANECSVLMTLLCEKMGLIPTKTTHNIFVETFANLQKESLEYQEELQEIYMSTTTTKQKKPRKTAVEVELQAWEEFPEKTDTFSNGDYK